jgi:hypothetical protein
MVTETGMLELAEQIPSGFTSIEFAEKLFVRRRSFGVGQIDSGFLNCANLPDEKVIAFERAELESAFGRGAALIFAPRGLTMEMIQNLSGNRTQFSKSFLVHDTDVPLGKQFVHQQFYKNDELTGDHWLVEPVIPESLDANYLDTTLALARHSKMVFGENPPPYVAEAQVQFENARERIQLLMMTDPVRAFRWLLHLRINRLFRPPPVLLLWLLMLCEGVNSGERLLANHWSWTNRCIPLANRPRKRPGQSWPVAIGSFGSSGVKIEAFDPWERMPCLGVCFARKGGC